jgi:hypothetical protein
MRRLWINNRRRREGGWRIKGRRWDFSVLDFCFDRNGKCRIVAKPCRGNQFGVLYVIYHLEIKHEEENNLES